MKTLFILLFCIVTSWAWQAPYQVQDSAIRNNLNDLSISLNYNWKSYTPTIGGGYTANETKGYYLVIGKIMFLQIQVSTITANGSGLYTWSLPTGYTINTNIVKVSTIVDADAGANCVYGNVGTGNCSNSVPTGWYMREMPALAFAVTNSTIALMRYSSTAPDDRGNGLGSAENFTGLAAACININCQIPIN